MNATKAWFTVGLLAAVGLFAGCGDDDSGKGTAPAFDSSGPEVCQKAVDHTAQCANKEAAPFLGQCAGEFVTEARATLEKSCEELDSGKADGVCDPFAARMGMCNAETATLGPWGYRVTPIAASTDDCRHNAEDLIEPGLKLMRVSSQETCMETKESRPVIDIGDDLTYRSMGVPYAQAERDAMIALYGLVADDAHMVLGNVGHTDAEFTVARVPFAAFDKAQAYYLIQTFALSGIQGSHGMIRVQFDAPVVELIRQFPSKTTAIRKTKDIILSVHAVAVRGGTYDPLGTGISNGMALARGVFSIENKVKAVLINRKEMVLQYKLKMTGNDIKRYVSSYVERAPERVFTTSYHTFGRNCGTELLQAFADAFPERNYPAPKSLAKADVADLNELLRDAVDGRLLPDIVPAKVRPALEERGLFEKEAPPWTEDPTVQAVVEQLRN